MLKLLLQFMTCFVVKLSENALLIKRWWEAPNKYLQRNQLLKLVSRLGRLENWAVADLGCGKAVKKQIQGHKTSQMSILWGDDKL